MDTQSADELLVYTREILAGSMMFGLATLSIGINADEDLFNAMDIDLDDSISLQETNNYPDVRLKFGVLDVDNNGNLSINEFSQYQGGVTFSDLDLDNDSLVSLEEASGLPDLVSRFSALDTNRDNQLNSPEFTRYQQLKSGISPANRQ